MGLLPDLFATRVAVHPDAMAVVFGEDWLSFAELDRLSNQLAHFLVDQGVGAESLVGLSVRRGPAMVVGVLGVLKAGAAYVPLEPTYPAARLRWMAESADVRLVLTEPGSGVPWSGMPVAHLDEAMAGRPVRSPDVRPHPVNLAYLIYTSGSTGLPKGVGVEHRNLTHLWSLWDEAYRLSEAPLRFVSVSGLSVDLFFADLMRSVFAGGTLIIALDEAIVDPSALLDLVERHGERRWRRCRAW